MRQLRTLKHVANSKLLSILDVTCQQLQNVRGEGTSDRQLRFLLDLLEQEQQVDQAKLQIVAWRRMCQRGVSGILVIATTSVALFVTPTYSTVTIGFVLFLSNWMWLGIDNMFNSIADLDHYANSASRLGEFINDVAPRVADSKAALTRQYRGAIEFKEVSIDRRQVLFYSLKHDHSLTKRKALQLKPVQYSDMLAVRSMPERILVSSVAQPRKLLSLSRSLCL